MEAEQYQKFCELLEQRSGILLGADKRYLVETRLSRVLRDLKIEYDTILEKSAALYAEWEDLDHKLQVLLDGEADE